MIAVDWLVWSWHRLCGCLCCVASPRRSACMPATMPPDERLEARVRAAIEQLDPLSRAIFDAWGTAEPEVVARLFGLSLVDAEQLFIAALVHLDHAAHEKDC